MAYSTVQTQTAMSTVASKDITATLASVPTEGNLCVAVAMHTGNNVLPDTDQNGWGPRDIATGNACVVYLWSKTAGPAEADTFLISSAVDVTWAIWLNEYTGNDSATVVDYGEVSSSMASGASSYSLTAASTPRAAQEIAICVFAQNASARTATTWSDSFIEACDLQPAGTVLGALAVADKQLSSQTAPHCTVTLSGVTAAIPSMMIVGVVGNPGAANTRVSQQSNLGGW